MAASNWLQTALAAGLCLAAGAYLLWRSWRALRGGRSGCGSCGSCPAQPPAAGRNSLLSIEGDAPPKR